MLTAIMHRIYLCDYVFISRVVAYLNTKTQRSSSSYIYISTEVGWTIAHNDFFCIYSEVERYIFKGG